jgi:hypothetical protein
MKKYKKKRISEKVVFLNSSLLIIAGALLMFYVFGVNNIAAGNYRIGTLQGELGKVTEENGALLADKLTMESSPSVKEYATRSGLVEAVSVIHIFENKGVALGNSEAAN